MEDRTLFVGIVFGVVVIVAIVLVIRSRMLREKDFGAWHAAYLATTESPETDPVRLKELWSADLRAQGEARLHRTQATTHATAVATAQGPHTSAPGTNSHNSLAVVSFIFSLLGGLLGIVLGHIALAQIRRTGADGRGLAIAGVVLGYLWLAGYVAFFVIGFVVYAVNS